MTIDEQLPETIATLLRDGRRAYEGERPAEALDLFRRARDLADEAGNRRASDRAFVNECAVLIGLERAAGIADESLQRLREMLMAGDPVNARLAAYNIARAYEFQKEFLKGLFYARIALDRATVLDRADWIASSRNQIGNLLLAESRMEEACDEYRSALELLPEGPSSQRALILTNLGYSRAVLGQLRDGARLIYDSLRMLRSVGARREQVIPLLDLSYVLLKLERPKLSMKHGLRALELAEHNGEKDSVRLAYYLLGEAAQQAGDTAGARAYFERLQRRFFPSYERLADFLFTVDIRNLVNLKA